MQSGTTIRILHICTYAIGGAAKAAIGLHHSLVNDDRVNSNIVFLNCRNNNIKKAASILPIQNLWKRIGFSLKYRLNNLLKRRIDEGFIFNSPKTIFNINDFFELEKFDIIHLHWIGDFIDWPSFFPNIKVPIVWTLHDENPFLGGYHYEFYLQNEVIPRKRQLESEYRDIKLQSLKNTRNLRVVAPSKWLLKKSKESKLFNKYNHSLIPYGITMNYSKSLQVEARGNIGISLESKVVVSIADDLSDVRKGANHLLELIKSLPNVTFLTAGSNMSVCHNNHLHLGYLEKETQLRDFYSAGDLYLITTLADNLPNTVLEAMFYGLPIVGFDIGGIPDMVKSGENGRLVEVGNQQGLEYGINEIFSSKHKLRKFGENSRKIALNNFSIDIQKEKYVELYCECLEQLE